MNALTLARGKFENERSNCPFHGSKFEICIGKNTEWAKSFVGTPLPNVAQKMIAMGKTSTDVKSFAVTQESSDLFVDA